MNDGTSSFDKRPVFVTIGRFTNEAEKLSEPIRYSPVLKASQRSHRVVKDHASRGSWQSVKIASLLVRN